MSEFDHERVKIRCTSQKLFKANSDNGHATKFHPFHYLAICEG